MSNHFTSPHNIEEIITFKNRHNTFLNGILHKPIRPKYNSIIIFTHSGVRGRLGNTRQFVYYARELAKSGYFVFRFDPSGFGYSEGDIENCELNKLFRDVQLGKYTNDTLDAIKMLKLIFPNYSFYLFGLCGGAITALHTAAHSDIISKMILLSIPVRLEHPDISIHRNSKYARKKIFTDYFLKLFTIRLYIRAFSISKKELFSSITWFKTLLSSSFLSSKKKFPLNKKFIESLKTTNKNKIDKIFFFGSDQNERYEFENEFLNKYPEMVRKSEIFIIKDANHMFSLPHWQKDILDVVIDWLQS